MHNFFRERNLGFMVAMATALPVVSLANPSIGETIKNCPPVVRSLKTKKLYCAHELKLLKQQAAEEQAGFLCLLIRTIIPPNDLIKLNQCFAQANLSSSTGNKMIQRPKGDQTGFALLSPLSKMQLTPQPIVTWQPIPNASYRVTIESRGQWLSSHVTNTTEFKLPASRFLKNDGNLYTLSVVAFKGDQVVAEDTMTLQLVDPRQLKEIDSAILQAQKLVPSPLDRGLDKAMMLYHLGLFDAAVAELSYLNQYHQEPALYVQLGLIYKDAGHKGIAQGYFDKASELANRKIKPVSKLH